MGCSPHLLPSLSTRAVDVGLTLYAPISCAPAPGSLSGLVASSSSECTLKELYHGIHVEAVLPVDHVCVMGVMSTWEQVPQLASLVRVKAAEGRYQVGFCESPCDPNVVPFITRAKEAILQKASELNLARLNSDCILLRACASLGTGSHVVMEVQHGITHLTFVESLRSAMREVAWQGWQQGL